MKTISLFIISLLTVFASQANHLLGGAISYKYKTSNSEQVTYTISVTHYRDCERSSIEFNPEILLTFYHAQNKQLFKSVTLKLKESEYLAPNCNSIYTICIQSIVYEKEISVPLSNSFYLYASECCRSENINTIYNVSAINGNGLALISFLPAAKYKNNSPEYNFKPTALLESNTLSFQNWSATDFDGDSLVYKLVPPLSGNSSYLSTVNRNLNDTSFVKYNPGFSSEFPLGINADIKINSSNGIISFFNPATGNYAFCIEIREYRKKELIGIHRRDFPLNFATTTGTNQNQKIHLKTKLVRLNEVYLNWQVCFLQFQHMSLEKKIANANWQEIYRSKTNLSYIDTLSFNTWNYYRVKTTDLNGDFFSNIDSVFTKDIPLSIANPNNKQIMISPNPAHDYISIDGSKGNLKIYDYQGLLRIETDLSELYNNVKIDISNLSPGLYFIILNNENDAIKERFLKL